MLRLSDESQTNNPGDSANDQLWALTVPIRHLRGLCGFTADSVLSTRPVEPLGGASLLHNLYNVEHHHLEMFAQ